MTTTIPNNQDILDTLDAIFQSEMSGVVRYLHYSFMIMGHNRIPIQKWLRDQATESMNHAIVIGEKITALGGHPPVLTAEIKESNVHTVDQILQESLDFETKALEQYKKLVKLAVAADDIALEEMGRGFVRSETEHVEEVHKMIRRH